MIKIAGDAQHVYKYRLPPSSLVLTERVVCFSVEKEREEEEE